MIRVPMDYEVESVHVGLIADLSAKTGAEVKKT